jgi:hypothetical protein
VALKIIIWSKFNSDILCWEITIPHSRRVGNRAETEFDWLALCESIRHSARNCITAQEFFIFYFFIHPPMRYVFCLVSFVDEVLSYKGNSVQHVVTRLSVWQQDNIGTIGMRWQKNYSLQTTPGIIKLIECHFFARIMIYCHIFIQLFTTLPMWQG